jgi:hypothetical protein
MTFAAQNRILILGTTNILSKKMFLSKFFLPRMVSMRQKFRARQKYSSFQFRHYLEVLKIKIKYFFCVFPKCLDV